MEKQIHTITGADHDIRLDRWFKRHMSQVPHSLLEKALRKGHIRINGKRSKASDRLASGDVLDFVPFINSDVNPAGPRPKKKIIINPEDIEAIKGSVIYKDEQILAINKPAGLAVQGGNKIEVSVDSLLGYLKLDSSERPKLVHRLDKDTSGVLLLARDTEAAAKLANSFKERQVHKEYLAIIVGRLPESKGTIDIPIAKSEGNYEKMQASSKGLSAHTNYEIVARGKHQTALVKLTPITGRKHQLRIHMQLMQTPILGDGKYGGKGAFIEETAPQLHLHSCRTVLTSEYGGEIYIIAPLPEHFRHSLQVLGMRAPQKFNVRTSEY